MLKESAPEDLVDGVRTVTRGEVYLSPAIAGVVVSHYRKGLVRIDPAAECADPTPPPGDPVPYTKLHRPHVRKDIFERKALHKRLDESIKTPLTLASAPAGYGKTTLISHWLERSRVDHAWISLDENDKNPGAFLRCLVAAIRGVFPELCMELAGRLDAFELPALSTLVATLGNDLKKIITPFVLVLDDYHHIPQNSRVHEMVGAFLARPASHVRMVIMTRRRPPLPMAPLRLRQKLTEIGVREMVFDRAETDMLLDGMVSWRIDE